MEADPELDGAHRPGGAGVVAAGVGGRSNHDERDARRACRRHALVKVAWRADKGLVSARALSALLAMNFAWLLGFTSFLLGSCLFPITLGIWWEGRYRLSSSRIASLAVLLCLGYFCHLVSLGLTVVGLAVLSVAGPVLGDGQHGSSA